MLQRNIGDWVVVKKEGSYYDGCISLIHKIRENDSVSVDGYFLSHYVRENGNWYIEDTSFKTEEDIEDIGDREHPNVIPLPDLTNEYRGYINLDRKHLDVGCQSIPFERIAELVTLLDRVAPGWRDVRADIDEAAGINTGSIASL